MLVPECLAEPPARYRTAAETMVAELGEAASTSSRPSLPSSCPAGTAVDQLLRRTWMPSLAVTGIDGLPSVNDGGNVLRPFTTLKIALRLPPSVDPDLAGEAVARALSADPPQGAQGEGGGGERVAGFRRACAAGVARARAPTRLRGPSSAGGGSHERGRDDPVHGRRSRRGSPPPTSSSRACSGRRATPTGRTRCWTSSRRAVSPPRSRTCSPQRPDRGPGPPAGPRCPLRAYRASPRCPGHHRPGHEGRRAPVCRARRARRRARPPARRRARAGGRPAAKNAGL